MTIKTANLPDIIDQNLCELAHAFRIEKRDWVTTHNALSLTAGETFNDMEDFGLAKQEWFKTFLSLGNAENVATLRRLALNLLQQEKTKSAAAKAKCSMPVETTLPSQIARRPAKGNLDASALGIMGVVSMPLESFLSAGIIPVRPTAEARSQTVHSSV